MLARVLVAAGQEAATMRIIEALMIRCPQDLDGRDGPSPGGSSGRIVREDRV